MVKSYYLAGAASAICVILITFAASSALFLLNDINSFYSEAQEELGEFKDLANNVWDYMIYDASPEELREAEEMDKIREERIKRSYDDVSGYGRDPVIVPSTSQTVPPLTKVSTASEPEEEQGYDFPSQETGPPASRPKKPDPPTMPRIIQGFRAPPPQATSTIKPPFLSNQNYNKPRISNYYNNGREPARPYQPYHPGNTPAPYNPIPNTQNPPQPGGEDDVATQPPNWPKVYNTRRPNNPNYPDPGYETPGRAGTTRGPYVFSTVGIERPGHPFPTLQPQGGYSTPGFDNSGRPLPPQNTQRPVNPNYPTTQSPGFDESGRPLPNPNTQQPPNYATSGTDRSKGVNPTTQTPPNRATPGFETQDRRNPNTQLPTGPATGRVPGNNQRPQTYPEDRLNPQTPRFPSSRNNGKTSGQCDMCGQQPNVCPPGPVGPRGRPGPPGFPGQDGPRGLRGLNGDHVAANTPNYDPIIGCIQCPLGPPGERGADGPQGPPGDDGTEGENGYNGKDGNPGNPGPLGQPGMRGTPGRPGKPGTPGRMGQACRSIPGPPGAPGTAGLPGRAGDPGIDGEHGQDGSPGIQGPPGRDGQPGADGQEGQSRPGLPGTDAGYCPCPRRSSKYEVVDDGSYHEKSPQPHPRDNSVEVEKPTRGRYAEGEPEYERPRHQNKYDTSAAVPDREYENSERIRPRSGNNRPHDTSVTIPDRKAPQYASEDNYRPESRRVHADPLRQPDQENGNERRPAPKGGYESDREGKTEYESESDQRPPPPVREYENEGEHRRPLKKVEIHGKHVNKQNRGSQYEEPGPRTPEYSVESSFEDEERRKTAHPPGIRFRRPHTARDEEDLPRVRKTERYEGDEQENDGDRRRERYEDISKSNHGKKPAREQGSRKEYDNDNERQVVESRSRKPYVEPQYDNRPSHVSSKDQEQPYRQEPKSKSNYETEQPMEKSPSTIDNSEYQPETSQPLPSEPVPYRRRLRFYRNKYYEKYL